MNGPWHLLYPLFSSIVFVFGALFAKAAAVRGTNPYTNTFACNICLASIWGVIGIFQGNILPVSDWGPVALIASAFVFGQLCTYLAFEYGDVSLATPVLGVKILFVAMISSLLADTPLPLHLWIAAGLASLAVGIVQAGGGSSRQAENPSWKTVLSVVLALIAAFAYSCFDVGLQFYGARFGAMNLLTTMFVMMGAISCLMLPWVDHPRENSRMKAFVPLTVAAVLIAVQAISLSYALGQHGDATRVNIIYSLRGIWSVVIAWMLSRWASSAVWKQSPRTMWFRLTGAVLLLICVIVALS